MARRKSFLSALLGKPRKSRSILFAPVLALGKLSAAKIGVKKPRKARRSF